MPKNLVLEKRKKKLAEESPLLWFKDGPTMFLVIDGLCSFLEEGQTRAEAKQKNCSAAASKQSGDPLRSFPTASTFHRKATLSPSLLTCSSCPSSPGHPSAAAAMAPPENPNGAGPTAPSEPAQPPPAAAKSKGKKKEEKKDDDLVSEPLPSPCVTPKGKIELLSTKSLSACIRSEV